MTSFSDARANDNIPTALTNFARMAMMFAMGILLIVVMNGCAFDDDVNRGRADFSSTYEDKKKALEADKDARKDRLYEISENPNSTKKEKEMADLEIQILFDRIALHEQIFFGSTATKKRIAQRLGHAEARMAQLKSSGARTLIRANVVKSQNTATNTAVLQAPGSTLNRCEDPDDADCD